MILHTCIGLLCILGGIAFIASAFYLQRLEDGKRMPGFYTTATIVAIKPHKNKAQTAVTFELTKDFRVCQVTNDFPTAEAENWKTGRRSLVVYDEEQQKIYYNPMRKSRNAQALVMGTGFVVLLFGVSWTIFASTL